MFVLFQEKDKTSHARRKARRLGWWRGTSLGPHFRPRGICALETRRAIDISRATVQQLLQRSSTEDSPSKIWHNEHRKRRIWPPPCSVDRISEPLRRRFFFLFVCFQSCWEISFFKFININYYFLEGKRHKVPQRSPDSKSLCFVCLSTAVFLWLKLYSVNTYSCLL